MTIDKSGRWWTGTGPDDIGEYLREYRAGGYEVGETATAVCDGCQAAQFRLKADGVEGFAERTCAVCGKSHMMLDSQQYAKDAHPVDVACPCGNDVYEVAVGFARREDGSIKWVSVGERCTRDGVLGSCADWKIDYAPAEHLRSAV